jgi:transposase
MIKKTKVKFANGSQKTQIRVVQGYRPGANLPPKQRTIKNFGYLEDQKDAEKFLTEVADFDATFKAEHAPLHIEADFTAQMYNKNNRSYNYGYAFFEQIYHQLEVESFIQKYLDRKNFKGHYSPAAIFKFLVLYHLLQPDSKRATFQLKNNLYGMKTDFDLDDVYHTLDYCADFEVELQRYLNEKIKSLFARDTSYVYYDVTNCYFEIDLEEGIKMKGVSKEHRLDPLVALGLFIDNQGLPLHFSLFPGNTPDTSTFLPTLSDVKGEYHLGRLVVVADKGMNSQANIQALVRQGDGYVFSQVLKGTKGRRFEKELFSSEGWKVSKDGSYRTKLFTEEILLKDKDKKLPDLKHQRQVLLYWSEAQAKKAAHKRADKLRRAEKAVKNTAYSIKHGAQTYIDESLVNEETGELVQGAPIHRSVALQKAEEDAKYDGYFAIVTSEMEYDEKKIRAVYGGLWKIEESFRVMKSDLEVRPIYVRSEPHIHAHFLICFVSLLLMRLLQKKLGKNRLSAERICNALNHAACQELRGGLIRLDDVGGRLAFEKRINGEGKEVSTLKYSSEDEIAKDYQLIQEAFGESQYQIFHRVEEFNRWIKKIILA